MSVCVVCDKFVEIANIEFCPYCGGVLKAQGASTNTTPAATLIAHAAEKVLNIQQGTLAEKLIDVAANVIQDQVHKQIGPMTQLLSAKLQRHSLMSSEPPPAWYLEALRTDNLQTDATTTAIIDAQAISAARQSVETTKAALSANKAMMENIVRQI